MQQAPVKKKKKVKVPKVVNGVETMVEIEVDDVGGPGWGPNDKHTLLNHHLRRVDGPIKVSGVAEYAFDKRAPGMLYGRVLRSPHAHARVLKIDSSAARRIPGVRAIVGVTDEQVVQGANKALTEADKKNPTDVGTAKAAPAPMVNFAGEPVAAVAADTAEIAGDAIRAIKVEYEVLRHVVRADDAMKDDAPKVYPEGNIEAKDKRGDLAKTEEALSKADVTIEAEYRTPIIHHASLETHGHMVDYRGGDSAIVYASTQGTFTIPGDAAKELGLPLSAVTAIVDHMGGGFGSKFGIGIEGALACRLAKQAQAPVKLMLTRRDEFLLSGNRSGSWQKFIAASLTEGAREAAVVEPPEELAAPRVELPIFSTTSFCWSPNSSATIARVKVRVPVPRSCVPTATTTEPSREIVTSTLHWLLPPPPQVPTAQPIPRFNGPAPAPGVLFRLSQPISRAPRSSCR